MQCKSRKKHLLLGLYLTLVSLLTTVHGELVNVTIDDQHGDPTNRQFIQYNPQHGWSRGQGCESCTAKPSPAGNAHMGTWMDATFFPIGGTNGVSGQLIKASVFFIGTAVYVQVILTGSISIPAGRTDLTFIIDGVIFGTFRREADGDSSYKFNQTVFSTTGLPNKLHTLTIESGNLGEECLLLLDSIIYTKETSENSTSTITPSSSPNSDIGIIVGPIVGGAAVGGSILALLFYLRRRRLRQRKRVLLDPPSPIDFDVRIDPYILNSTLAMQPSDNSNLGRLTSVRGAVDGVVSARGITSDPSRWDQANPMYSPEKEDGLESHMVFTSPPSYSRGDRSPDQPDASWSPKYPEKPRFTAA